MGGGGDKLGEKEGKTEKKENVDQKCLCSSQKGFVSFVIVKKNTTVVLF